MSSTDGSPEPAFGTLNRTLALLEAVASEPRPQSLSSLSRRVGVPKTSVHRLLRLLVRNDLLAHGKEGYTLGGATRRLSHLVLDRMTAEVSHVLEPFAGDLFERTGDCVVIGVPDGAAVETAYSLRSHRHTILPTVADRVPICHSAIGKLWLAALPDPALMTWLAAEGADQQRVLAELRRVRHTGVATTGADILPGAVEIAMPIVGTRGMVAGIARRYSSGQQRPSLAAALAHHQVALAASVAVRRLEPPEIRHPGD